MPLESVQPSTLEQIAPKPTNRALIVGQTGSGKTELAKQLLRDAIRRRKRYVLVVDFKGNFKMPDVFSVPAIDNGKPFKFKICTSLKALEKSKDRLLIYRPGYSESQDEVTQEKFWEWAYRRGHTTIFVDETAAVVNGDQYPHYYGGCLMRGRELGIELWSATQRPLRIPMIVLSESEDFYGFKCRMPQDRQRIEQVAAIPADRIASLAKHQFVYAPQDGEVVGPMKLELPKRAA